MEKKQLYLYGITYNRYPEELSYQLDNMGVQFVEDGELLAIVSEKKYINLAKAGRETLAKMLVQHQRVLEKLVEQGLPMPIPVKLGTFLKDRSCIQQILEKGRELCTHILNSSGDLVEVDIVANWSNFDEVLQSIMLKDPEVVALNQAMKVKAPKLSKEDYIQMGKLVKEKLDQRAGRTREQILEYLMAYCLEGKRHALLDDQMVANMAFLVSKEKVTLLEESLNQLDRKLNGELNFRFVGPLPCYSFHTLEIIPLDFQQIEQAKNQLELLAKASAKEVRQAYVRKAKTVHPDLNSQKEERAEFNNITKAYHTLTDYLNSVKQSSDNDLLHFTKEHVSRHSPLVRIKK